MEMDNNPSEKDCDELDVGLVSDNLNFCMHVGILIY